MINLALPNREIIIQNAKAALMEDLNGVLDTKRDITASLIPQEQQICATILTRDECVISGSAWVDAVFELIDTEIKIEWHVTDGKKVAANTVLATLTGNARALLTGERSALNLLQTLSGTATLTERYVAQIAHTTTQLLDTRKTIPGLRMAQKYAVTCGHGKNHRIGLYDAYLIKENHIMACGGIAQAIQRARTLNPERPIEVEVENFDELHQAIQHKADIVMLDNFSLEQMRQAVFINQGQTKLEASGNISLDNIARVAETGVDFISVGALTKHVTAIDLSFRVQTRLP